MERALVFMAVLDDSGSRIGFPISGSIGFSATPTLLTAIVSRATAKEVGLGEVLSVSVFI